MEEDEPKKEILIDDEDLKEDLENINKTVQDILDKKFPKIHIIKISVGFVNLKTIVGGYNENSTLFRFTFR